MSDTISVKREDLEEWREFMVASGCDGCITRITCMACEVMAIRQQMAEYLKKEDGK